MTGRGWALLAGTFMLGIAAAGEESAAERGRHAFTQKSYNPAVWSHEAYDKVWTRWEGIAAKPADYDRAFRETYGLHAAPYPNHGLPMGLHEGPFLFKKGMSVDCIVCHGHSIRTFDSRSNSIWVGCSCVRCLQLIDLYGGRDRTRTCGLLRVKQAL